MMPESITGQMYGQEKQRLTILGQWPGVMALGEYFFQDSNVVRTFKTKCGEGGLKKTFPERKRNWRDIGNGIVGACVMVYAVI